MHRRAARIGILAALGVLAGGAAPALALAQSPPESTLSAQVGATPTGQTLAPGFVGVSFEYRAMHAYTGRDPRTVNPVLVQLLRALAPGQAPVLRIGGDSTDSTWWPVPGVIPPGGITYGLTKGWIRTTQALAAALGARLIVGINLASGRPALAAAEARVILQGIGRRYVKALEIGNEPDLYGIFVWYRDRRRHAVLARPRGYDINAFTAEFSRWRAALPTASLAGPAFAGLSWMGGLDGFLSAEPGIGLVTFHRYPLRGCITDPTSPGFPSIRNLLNDQSSLGLAQAVAPFVTVAHAHGLPFRLDELNSAACRGRRGVSDTFASALWVLDTLFAMASVGVDGVNLHTLPDAAYEPFTFTHRGGIWRAFVHPVYYGMLTFARAFPAGAQLLPVNSPSGPVKVWATQGADGRTRVVLINKDPATRVLVQLQIQGAQTAASVESMLAPGLRARSGVTLGGQSFGQHTRTGTLPGHRHAARITPLGDVYSVQLPAGSALLLTR